MTTLLRPEQIRTASLYPLATLAERTAGTIPLVVMRRWPRGVRKDITQIPLESVSIMAPSRDLLHMYQHEGMPWETFAQAYRCAIVSHVPWWRIWIAKQLPDRYAVTLLCHEHDAGEDTVRCHRRLLRDMLLEQDGVR